MQCNSPGQPMTKLNLTQHRRAKRRSKEKGGTNGIVRMGEKGKDWLDMQTVCWLCKHGENFILVVLQGKWRKWSSGGTGGSKGCGLVNTLGQLLEWWKKIKTRLKPFKSQWKLVLLEHKKRTCETTLSSGWLVHTDPNGNHHCTAIPLQDWHSLCGPQLSSSHKMKCGGLPLAGCKTSTQPLSHSPSLRGQEEKKRWSSWVEIGTGKSLIATWKTDSAHRKISWLPIKIELCSEKHS